MRKYSAIALCIAVVLIFVINLFQNTLDLPSFDDYDTTLGFIRRFYFESGTFAQKAENLFSRHNEHRILISKFTAAVYFFFFKNLRFAHLVWFQNLFLVAFYALILAVMRRKNLLTPLNVLVCTIFLFSLSFWQVSFYYWGGIQHYTVFFFAFLSLFLLDKTEKPVSWSFTLAGLAAVLAVFSFGNGFLVLPAGAFLLFAKKKYQALAVWLVLALVLVLVTFLNMPQNQDAGAPFRIDWAVRLLLTFLGSFLYVNPPVGVYLNIIICMAAGLAVFGAWVWLFWKKYAFRNPLLYSMLSMPILTGMIIAISRFETKSAGGIAPRYMFFTACIPVVLFLIMVDLGIIRKVAARWIAGVGLVLWAVIFFQNKKELEITNTEVAETVKKWQLDHSTPLIYYREARPYSEMMQWATREKVIDINAALPDESGQM